MARIQVTRTVKFTLLFLRLYLIGMLALLVIRFLRVF
jgi:hypothetical protein